MSSMKFVVVVHYIIPINKTSLILLNSVLKTTIQLPLFFLEKTLVSGIIQSRILFIWTFSKHALKGVAVSRDTESNI